MKILKKVRKTLHSLCILHVWLVLVIWKCTIYLWMIIKYSVAYCERKQQSNKNLPIFSGSFTTFMDPFVISATRCSEKIPLNLLQMCRVAKWTMIGNLHKREENYSFRIFRSCKIHVLLSWALQIMFSTLFVFYCLNVLNWEQLIFRI